MRADTIAILAASGYAIAAIAWAVLAVLLTSRTGALGVGRLLIAAVVVESTWATTLAAHQLGLDVSPALVGLLESTLPLAWLAFLIAFLYARAGARPPPAVMIGASILAAASLILPVVSRSTDGVVEVRLVGAIAMLVGVEQVYRNAVEPSRWALKFLAIALASIAAFDIALYADAMLYQKIDLTWWAARGYAHSIVVPLIAVTAARVREWRIDVGVSRQVVYHTATVLGSGAFLLGVSLVGYGVTLFGVAWSGVAQTVLLFVAVIVLAAMAMSGFVRARIRVFLAKHFFSFRYDYRAEWLALTELLARPEGVGVDPLPARALDGLAAQVSSRSGAIWMDDGHDHFVCLARRGVDHRATVDACDPLPTFLATTGWIIDLVEWRTAPSSYGELHLPAWLAEDENAWLIVPLLLEQRLVGFAQLQRTSVVQTLDWETRDLLRTSGRQIAGQLAVRQGAEQLALAEQFASFNRMSAFVVHDLKNLVLQLDLMVSNAGRHHDNPEFQRDMVETVENVLDRMRRLLVQLGVSARPIEQPSRVRLAQAVRSAVAVNRGLSMTPTVEIEPTAEEAEVLAHPDRIERVIGHLLRNAIDATPGEGSVRVRVSLEDGRARLDVADTGCGMTREFVDTRLFRPFATTKTHGMGIGAYESKEYVREIGGSLDVVSAPGRGTVFTIRFAELTGPNRLARTETRE